MKVPHGFTTANQKKQVGIGHGTESLQPSIHHRYRMGDFIVMPNHIHLLVSFAGEQQMRQQFDSWLHWTATKINHATGHSGHFWQEEPFDHLVRSTEQYEYLRNYIRDNPLKAGLADGEYYYHKCDQ